MSLFKETIMHLVALIWLFAIISSTHCLDTPRRFRSEGKITWFEKRSGQTSSYEYYFLESVDQDSGHASLSIGDTDTDSDRFVIIPNSVGYVKINKEGNCIGSTPEDSDPVDEIEGHFLDLIGLSNWSKRDLTLIGPSVILDIIIKMKNHPNLLTNQTLVKYNNLDCKRYTSEVVFDNDKDTNVKLTLELTKPGYAMSDNMEDFILVKGTSSGSETDKTEFKIEYFRYEVIRDHQMREFRKEFNLPIARGCSRFLPELQPDLQATSVQMELSSRKPANYEYKIFFDQVSQFMRMDINEPEESLIWDSSKPEMKLLYVNQAARISSEGKRVPNDRLCVLLDVSNDQLPGTMEFITAGQLRLDFILGFKDISRIGYDFLNGFPSVIYEKLSSYAPPIFGLTKHEKETELDPVDGQYLIQYYVIDDGTSWSGSKTYQGTQDNQVNLTALDDIIPNFWPTRINLYRRASTDDPHDFELLRSYDVDELRWDLDATDLRKADLFRVPKCTFGQSNQTRLEMELFFDQIHSENADKSNQAILAKNSQLIEKTIIDQLIEKLEFDPMHLVESEFQLLPTHAELELTMSEIQSNRKLEFFDKGERPNDGAYMRNITYNALNERSCLINGALNDEAHFMVYCNHEDTESAIVLDNCIEILEPEVTVMELKPDEKHQEVCYFYKLSSDQANEERGIQELGHLIDSIDLIQNMTLKIQVPNYTEPSTGNKKGMVDLDAFITNYYLTNEMVPTVELGKSYDPNNSTSPDSIDPSLRTRSLRVFDNADINIRSRADCENFCHLDPHCHSYSFCNQRKSNDKQPQLPQCIISRLDLIESDVGKQLVGSDVILDKEDNVTRFKLLSDLNCNLYEHNYLGVYRQTNEFKLLKKSDKARYRWEPSAESCAHSSFHKEAENGTHITPMFAYCSGIKRCIMGKQLESLPDKAKKEKDDDNNNNNDKDQDVTSCRLFRRRYETYFTMTPRVFKMTEDKSLQMSHPTSSLDDCSRACLQQYRSLCQSMDYCESTKSCLINTHNTTTVPKTMLEIRPGCLHYDLNSVIASPHSPYEPKDDHIEAGSPVWHYIAVSLLALVLVAVGSLVGLPAGRMIYQRFGNTNTDSAQLVNDLADQPAESGEDGPVRNRAPRVRSYNILYRLSNKYRSYQEFKSDNNQNSDYENTSISLEDITDSSHNRNTIA